MAILQASLQPPPQTDEGLRKFFLTMYNHTAGGLGVSALVAYLTYSTGAINFLLTGFTMWLVFLAPLGMIFWYSFKGQDWPLSTLTNFYYAFVGVMGLSLSSIFAVYTATSIVEAFLTASLTFGAASVYGYTTKKDLSGWGSILIVGLIGIIIAGVVNIFLASSIFGLIISIVGIVIFLGLTAHDTQQAREIYYETGDSRYGIKFALNLYLNFINLFQMILSLTGYSSNND